MIEHGQQQPLDADDCDGLISRHLDGRLSTDEGQMLSRLLTENPEFARRLARASVLHQEARMLLKFDQSLSAPIESELESTWPRWAWFGTVSVFCTVVLALVWGNLTGRGVALHNERVVVDAAARRAAVAANVSGVEIDSGTARLNLPGIGFAVLEGPADFVLIEPMRARLTRGRIRIRVTETTGHGFVLETPHGEVTDLGTEFGVDLSDQEKSKLVVFEGAVDFKATGPALRGSSDSTRSERLVGGEGIEFWGGGRLSRVMSIVTGNVPTFRSQCDAGLEIQPIISSVTDNRNAAETKKFYEIVPRGLVEDAKMYVDRPHEWNGNGVGIPTYLRGADYVRTFNQDSVAKEIEIYVTLAAPAHLYVLLDDRSRIPEWVEKDFRDTGDTIGVDAGPWGRVNRKSKLGVGSGESIDHTFRIWERTIKETGVLTLKSSVPKGGKPQGMYGIAAKALLDK